LIKDTWSTKLIIELSANEGLAFSGFYGKYKATVTVKDKIYEVGFRHTKENAKPIVLDLSGQ